MIGNQWGLAHVSDCIRSYSKAFYSLLFYATKVYQLKQQCMYCLPLVNQFCYMAAVNKINKKR